MLLANKGVFFVTYCLSSISDIKNIEISNEYSIRLLHLGKYL